MAVEVVLPQLGLSMDSGQIMAWLKEPGDYVEPGDLLLEVEGDKSVVEVEAVAGGYLQILKGPDDGAIPVGEVIAYLLADGEDTDASDQTPVQKTLEMTSGNTKGASQAPAAVAAAVSTRASRPPSSPAARRRAVELGVDWRQATGTGPRGRIKERDVIALAESASATGPRLAPAETFRISPVAHRLAESAGLDVSVLASQRPGQRIERGDVEEAIRQAIQGAQLRSAQPGPASQAAAAAKREPISGLRRVIAERMAQSARSTAAVTLTTEADATELVRIRQDKKEDLYTEVAPSYNTLLVKLVAKALLEHPDLNASLDGETIITWQHINIGVAVDTERGLVVPVVRDASGKSVGQLAEEMNELLPRAKAGKALPDELTGGTFTITNLGAFEIDAFTPIINPPECAVLGVGRLVERYIIVDGQPAIRTMIALSLTFDHRLVDGAPAARFLQRVKHLVERPYLWLA
ncbi:MAG: dihydrolipoamide acetyltransferase family protein [Chloroflexota bacterium]